jgi:hypothetical protein
MALLYNGYIFKVLFKIVFAVHLKHSSFWLSADVEPMSNDLVHAGNTKGGSITVPLTSSLTGMESAV